MEHLKDILDKALQLEDKADKRQQNDLKQQLELVKQDIETMKKEWKCFKKHQQPQQQQHQPDDLKQQLETMKTQMESMKKEFQENQADKQNKLAQLEQELEALKLENAALKKEFENKKIDPHQRKHQQNEEEEQQQQEQQEVQQPQQQQQDVFASLNKHMDELKKDAERRKIEEIVSNLSSKPFYLPYPEIKKNETVLKTICDNLIAMHHGSGPYKIDNFDQLTHTQMCETVALWFDFYQVQASVKWSSLLFGLPTFDDVIQHFRPTLTNYPAVDGVDDVIGTVHFIELKIASKPIWASIAVNRGRFIGCKFLSTKEDSLKELLKTVNRKLFISETELQEIDPEKLVYLHSSACYPKNKCIDYIYENFNSVRQTFVSTTFTNILALINLTLPSNQ